MESFLDYYLRNKSKWQEGCNTRYDGHLPINEALDQLIGLNDK